MTHPVYKHACASCTFLGMDVDAQGNRVDLYFHKSYMGAAFKARYGDAPEDYTHVLALNIPVPSGIFTEAVINEARRLAAQRGLL